MQRILSNLHQDDVQTVPAVDDRQSCRINSQASRPVHLACPSAHQGGCVPVSSLQELSNSTMDRFLQTLKDVIIPDVQKQTVYSHLMNRSLPAPRDPARIDGVSR
jgi:hypothetical protein